MLSNIKLFLEEGINEHFLPKQNSHLRFVCITFRYASYSLLNINKQKRDPPNHQHKQMNKRINKFY